MDIESAAQLRRIEAAEQRAKRAENEDEQFGRKIGLIEREINVLKRVAEVEAARKIKRQWLDELQGELKNVQSTVSQDNPAPRRGNSDEREEVDLAGAAEGADGDEREDAPIQPRTQFSTTRGQWTERGAWRILGKLIDLPLVQTVLNYFEPFMTERMLEELGGALRKEPRAQSNLRVLRAHWGVGSVDYFAEYASYPTRKSFPQAYSWNHFYHQGFLRSRYGGPNMARSLVDRPLTIEEYRTHYNKPLFGYESQDANGHTIDPHSLTSLYQSFLRTTHGFNEPCDAHRLGILGATDVCNGCGQKGMELAMAT